MLKATKNIFKSKKEFVKGERICINVKWSIRLYKLAKKESWLLIMKYQLNKNIPIPLYFQLKQHMIEQIEREELKPGDSILSERELSEMFSISRMTVRQALLELVNEGKLIREQGRGTFVAQPKIDQGLYKLTSFSEDMVSRGLKPGAYVVDVDVTTPPSSVGQVLGLEEKSKTVILTRVRLADEKPMALETTHLPVDRFPELAHESFEGVSLYRLLSERYGVAPARASQTIEVGMPTAREINLLQVRADIPMMLIKRVTFDSDGHPFEYVKSVYPGDRYKFHSELAR